METPWPISTRHHHNQRINNKIVDEEKIACDERRWHRQYQSPRVHAAIYIHFMCVSIWALWLLPILDATENVSTNSFYWRVFSLYRRPADHIFSVLPHSLYTYISIFFLCFDTISAGLSPTAAVVARFSVVHNSLRNLVAVVWRSLPFGGNFDWLG